MTKAEKPNNRIESDEMGRAHAPSRASCVTFGNENNMTWSTQYETALLRVAACAKCGQMDALVGDKDLFTALGSISNTETFIAQHSAQFTQLGSDRLQECLVALAKLESNCGDSPHASWYFVNTFAQLLSLYRALCGGTMPRDLLGIFLSIRKNERMPFAKAIGLHVRSLADYDAYLDAEARRQAAHVARMQQGSAAKAEKATSDIWKAIKRNDGKGVAGLLAKGADVNARSPDGLSMEQCAESCGHSAIAEMIRNYRQKV